MILLCELFGFISKKPTEINKKLNIFFSHGNKHPHGFGLAYWNDKKNSPVIYKDSIPSIESKELKNILNNPIKTGVALGHIRFATIGSVKKVNCHPFIKKDSSGRIWTLIHNGNIYSGLQLLPFEIDQVGETDSERILLYLIAKINDQTNQKGRPLNNLERSKIVEILIYVLSPRNRLNLLIFDSEQLYVHANLKHSLYVANHENSYYFSTTPLDNELHWKTIPINRLFVYSKSELVYSGLRHNYEFIKSEPSNFDNFMI